MKKIIAIGIDLASEKIEQVSLRATTSLLDWDIILFRPNRNDFFEPRSGLDYYRGKPSLDDSESVAITEASRHWNRQFKDALQEGKTIVYFLPPPETVYIGTGEHRYSGTGKNQKTTRIVTEFELYDFGPVPDGWLPAEGTSMTVHPAHRDMLASYWDEFGSLSTYNTTWKDNSPSACIHTKSGNRPVAHVVRPKDAEGTIIFLPDLPFDDSEFVAYDDYDEEVWTEKAKEFSERLVKQVVALSAATKMTIVRTPVPQWANAEAYILPGEQQAKDEILAIETRLEEIEAQREQAATRLNNISEYRDLLFETGKRLEFSILESLNVLGFVAENYDDGVSEFDAVFLCDEGRLIGEAEGKDNKAVNISKLRQIATNIHEDLKREEVERPAKGVLFGNAYRLKHPKERDAPFTDKCIASAAATSVALVDTTELFRVVRYMLHTNDEAFAQGCRLAILNTNGVVAFPETPEAEYSSQNDDTSDAS